jgi:hypothetical protein
VTPIDHTKITFGCSASIRANRIISCRDAPADRSSDSQSCSASALVASANPMVCSAMKSLSIIAFTIRCFSTPFRNARSPPVCTPKNSSQIFVPNSALSATEGTQYRSMPGSRCGLTTATFVPARFA